MSVDASAAIEAYDGELVARLHSLLDEDLAAVYTTGSTALGDYTHGRSDLDRLVVCERPLAAEAKEALVAALRHEELPCPARGLELVVYARAAVERATRGGAFEVNLNTGPRMPLHVSFDATEEPEHWFVLDRAIARSRGRALFGPPPTELLAAIPRSWSLEGLAASLAWHRANADVVGENLVLNACRAWVFAAEDRWVAKREAAAWALEREPGSTVVAEALSLRAGRPAAPLDGPAAVAFVARVARVVDSARGRTVPP